MKPSSIKKVFGIISYFPDNDSDYHIETRRERSRRFKELLYKLEEYWSDVDILVIAQNWQDFELPNIKNTVITYHYGRLGILGARKELRRRFLSSKYDYLIMLDDDAMVSAENPQGYMEEIDRHPGGIGALRKRQCPLQFLAISKEVYSQIDMPNVDAEKGEGFEDDIFTATCFAQFPDKAYMFPQGLVTETSFRYEGPGKCPSTWAREHKYNWTHMREFTRSTVDRLENSIIEDTPEVLEDQITPSSDIDLIITYVNSSDTYWVKDFIKATKTHNPSPTRFRSWGTLRYLLRGVAKYMPFVRNVILIVSRETQIPYWLDRSKVRIVYHKDYIPEKFLPTFNSCTIESFFWNIPDLSDKVIYFNDDMFPINTLKESDFFTGDLPNIKFTGLESYSARNMFRSQCRSGIDLVSKALNLPTFETGKIIRPYHISNSITKEGLLKIQELCKDTLPATVTKLRNNKNVNQYIYSYYQYFTGKYANRTVDYKYFELNDATIDTITQELLNSKYQMICLNDSERINNFTQVREKLWRGFDQKFPSKSRFEE